MRTPVSDGEQFVGERGIAGVGGEGEAEAEMRDNDKRVQNVGNTTTPPRACFTRAVTTLGANGCQRGRLAQRRDSCTGFDDLAHATPGKPRVNMLSITFPRKKSVIPPPRLQTIGMPKLIYHYQSSTHVLPGPVPKYKPFLDISIQTTYRAK